MTSRWILFLVLPYNTGALAQAETGNSTQELYQSPALVRDAYQGGWSVEAPLQKEELEKAAENDAQYNRRQLDQLRWERNVCLAKNQGVIPAMDQDRLLELATALNVQAPGSFEAHMANYYTQFPSPSAFQELDLATLQGGDRQELVAPQLVNAARKDNASELSTRAKAMKTRGDIAPPLFAVAADIMASVEPEAVLFAAGEMDAYPLWVEQFANGKRKDMLVVDERLLVDPAYRTRIWERSQANGAVPQEAGFIDALASSTARPVYISLSLGAPLMQPLKDKLFVTGLAMRVSPTGMQNIPLLENRWDRLKKPMDAGPLSRNYLVPGAVLLNHYRSIGDEARAARLEHELREMAVRLGATNALIKTGVLPH